MSLQSVNYKDKLFVLSCQGGTTCLGFDRCQELTNKLAHELGVPVTVENGTPRAYAEYERLCAIGAERNRNTGWYSVAELTPQLIGLEGCRVMVWEENGLHRRFIVGKSTGWMPCHLELRNRRSTGGCAVSGTPFKRVVKLYRAM